MNSGNIRGYMLISRDIEMDSGYISILKSSQDALLERHRFRTCSVVSRVTITRDSNVFIILRFDYLGAWDSL